MHPENYQPNRLLSINSIGEVDLIIHDYFKKETLTNNYILLEDYKEYVRKGQLFCLTGAQNAALFVSKLDFYRLYYFINDTSETIPVDIASPVVMEILFRGPSRFPRQEISYWVLQGFRIHLQRDCYVLTTSRLGSLSDINYFDQVEVNRAISAEDIQYVKSKMEKDLDHFTGDMLTYNEIEAYCGTGDVWIVSVGGNKAGFLQASFKNKVYWLEHIVISTNYRGMGLSKALMMAYFKEGLGKGCRSFQLWVINENTAAVNLYRKFEFRYMNKSTISLLKDTNE